MQDNALFLTGFTVINVKRVVRELTPTDCCAGCAPAVFVQSYRDLPHLLIISSNPGGTSSLSCAVPAIPKWRLVNDGATRKG